MSPVKFFEEQELYDQVQTTFGWNTKRRMSREFFSLHNDPLFDHVFRWVKEIEQ